MPSAAPKSWIAVREQRGEPFFEALWRHEGKLVKRRIGPAWLERDKDGWRRRRRRVPEGSFDQPAAYVEAARLAAEYAADVVDRHRMVQERRSSVTFREVAQAYLVWLADVKAAKPSTLADYRYTLSEPGVPHKRGGGVSSGHIMASLGDMRASEITVQDVDRMLATVERKGNKEHAGEQQTGRRPTARLVNKHRAVVSSVFGFGMKDSTFALARNPAAATDKRKEAHRAALLFYTPEEVERLARAMAAGEHRAPARPAESDEDRREDSQDGEIVRVAAYTGLRMGELLALRWRDVDFKGSALTVARALSVGVESATKSGKVRRVPLPSQAAQALERLKQRQDFIGPNDLVFCSTLGRSVNGSALRRRFKRAQDATGIRRLRFHDLRHTYGSLLAAGGVDLVTIQAAMGHSALATTSRYLHARPATEQAEAFTKVFALNTSPC
jgi:integrase